MTRVNVRSDRGRRRFLLRWAGRRRFPQVMDSGNLRAGSFQK